MIEAILGADIFTGTEFITDAAVIVENGEIQAVTARAALAASLQAVFSPPALSTFRSMAVAAHCSTATPMPKG